MSHVLLGFSTKKNDWLSRMICWATSWQHAVELALQKTEYDSEYFRDWVFRRAKNGNLKKLTCHECPDVCAARAGQAFLPADMKHTIPRDLYLLSKEQ